MVEVSIDGDRAVFHIAGADGCWSFKTSFDIPLASIRGVSRDAARAADRFSGLKLAGTGVPYVFRAGRYERGDLGLWGAPHPEHAVIIELDDDQYSELVVEVAAPSEVVALLEGALARQRTGESEDLPNDPALVLEFNALGFDAARTDGTPPSASDDLTLTLDGLEHLHRDLPGHARLQTDALLSVGNLEEFFESVSRPEPASDEEAERLSVNGVDLFHAGTEERDSPEPASPVSAPPEVASANHRVDPSGAEEAADAALPALVEGLASKFRRLGADLDRVMHEG